MRTSSATREQVAENTTEESARGVLVRLTLAGLRRWRLVALTVLVVATTGFAAHFYYFVYRQDMQTDAAVRHQVVKAASDGAVALLSYSPSTLERDLTNARSKITEGYLAYYLPFADQIVGPAAQRGLVTTTATVVKAGLEELRPNSAVALVFVKLKTARKERPQPIFSSSSLRMTLTKANGAWLIEKLEAVGPQRL